MREPRVRRVLAVPAHRPMGGEVPILRYAEQRHNLEVGTFRNQACRKNIYPRLRNYIDHVLMLQTVEGAGVQPCYRLG